jgi:hypothetical protein
MLTGAANLSQISKEKAEKLASEQIEENKENSNKNAGP